MIILTIDSIFNRLKSGIYYDNDFKPYKKEFLEKILEYFQEREKYEECVIILNIIQNRFDHENNFKKIKI